MKTLLQYRSAAIGAIITQLFWGLIVTMIFTAFYSGASGPEPISLRQSLTFLWLGQSLLQILPFSIDREIDAQIKNGNVAYDLVRPIHLYGIWYSRAFAMRSIPTLIRCLPIFIFGGFFGLTAPISIMAALTFLVSVVLALFLASAITTLVHISFFWTLSGEGIHRLLPHITVFLSGLSVPLPLFPNWMQSFLNIQPIRGILDIPCRLYMGLIPTDQAPFYFAFQLGWLAFFILFGKWLMRRAMKNFIIQGG